MALTSDAKLINFQTIERKWNHLGVKWIDKKLYKDWCLISYLIISKC